MADAIVSLGLDASAFESGLARATQSAQGFGGRMGGVMSHPYLIAAAAAFGLGKAAVQARSEADRLHLSVMKMTSNSGGGLFRSEGDIDKNITGLTEKLSELKEAANPTSFGGFVKKILGSDAFFPGMKSTQDIHNEQDRAKVEKAIAAELEAQVTKQQALTALQAEAFSGSEREAAIQKSLLEYRERIGDIDEKYAGVEGGGETRNRLQAEAAQQNRTELQAINRRFDLKQREVESEIRLGELRKTGIGQEAMSIAIIRQKLALINQELRNPITNERRDQLSAERLGLEGQGREIYRQRTRELLNARDVTQMGRLQGRGDAFGARLFGISSGARGTIEAAMRNLNPALANEALSQSSDDVRSTLADEMRKSPAQRRAEMKSVRKRQLELDRAGALIADMENRKRLGAYGQSGDEPAARASKTMDDLYTLIKRAWLDE